VVLCSVADTVRALKLRGVALVNGPDDYIFETETERASIDISQVPHTLADWLNRDLPAPDCIMGLGSPRPAAASSPRHQPQSMTA
jgi:hypothetical protein